MQDSSLKNSSKSSHSLANQKQVSFLNTSKISKIKTRFPSPFQDIGNSMERVHSQPKQCFKIHSRYWDFCQLKAIVQCQQYWRPIQIPLSILRHFSNSETRANIDFCDATTGFVALARLRFFHSTCFLPGSRGKGTSLVKWRKGTAPYCKVVKRVYSRIPCKLNMEKVQM